VRLTGLPRFDRLLEIGARIGPSARDLVLVAPTWRVQFAPLVQAGSHHRRIDPSFFESDFLHSWMGLLRSPTLARAAEEHGLTVAFLPHPDLQPAVPDLELPAHVRPLTFVDNDAQELFARCAVLVTDYSSMAFNAAYINRPVVYFQFDREAVLSGSHLGRRGYFDYHAAGFGPVTESVESAVEAILATLDAGRDPVPEYQRRIDAAFPLRDGLCCARVVDEIVASVQPAPEPSDAGHPLEAASHMGAPLRG
jgi:CDP-glycerol glycerophosphotransferase (TagB/SpsB family)